MLQDLDLTKLAQSNDLNVVTNLLWYWANMLGDDSVLDKCNGKICTHICMNTSFFEKLQLITGDPNTFVFVLKNLTLH